MDAIARLRVAALDQEISFCKVQTDSLLTRTIKRREDINSVISSLEESLIDIRDVRRLNRCFENMSFIGKPDVASNSDMKLLENFLKDLVLETKLFNSMRDCFKEDLNCKVTPKVEKINKISAAIRQLNQGIAAARMRTIHRYNELLVVLDREGLNPAYDHKYDSLQHSN